MRLWCLLIVVAACGNDPQLTPVFRADYTASFTEVRNCRSSSDHDLNRIRVLADPDAMPVYLARDRPFPTGSIVLKEEFDFGDTACSGPIKQWTVMQRLDIADNLGWKWQLVTADREVETEDEPRCIGCHASCGVPPDGHDGTCTLP